ncbi:MAG: ArnT family glycosyltransferase [Thermodesulfobacteriota bacterium]
MKGLFRKAIENFSYFYFLAGFLVLLSAYYALFGRIDHDEVEGVHTAWKISVGETIYGDFFQHHHPLSYYALIPFVKMGGETLLAFHLSELFVYLVFLATVFVTFLLAGRIYRDKTTSLISVILLLSFPYFILKGTEIRPDAIQVFFNVVSFYFFAVFMTGGTRKHLILSAVCLFLSFFALQKTVFLVAIFGVGQLYFVYDGKMPLKQFILYWLIFCGLCLVYAGHLFINGDLGNYIDFNWLVNMRLIKEFSPFSSLFPLSSPHGILPALSMLIFVFLLIRGCFLRAGALHNLTAVAAAGLLLSIFLVKTPFPQYLLAASPFAAMVAASSLRRISGDLTIKICLAFLVILSAPFLISGAQLGKEKAGRLALLEFVRVNSSPQDTYIGYPANLFRKDADFFWFCTHRGYCLDAYNTFRDYDYDALAIIKENPPKIILVAPGGNKSLISALSDEFVIKNYKHYQVLVLSGNEELRVRKW